MVLSFRDSLNNSVFLCSISGQSTESDPLQTINLAKGQCHLSNIRYIEGIQRPILYAC